MDQLILKQRQHIRHKCKGILLVSDKLVGQVLDLSYGGISLGFTSDKICPEFWTADLINASGIHIKDLPIQTVWSAKAKQPPSIHAIKFGAKFRGELTPDQANALDQLLDFLGSKS